MSPRTESWIGMWGSRLSCDGTPIIASRADPGGAGATAAARATATDEDGRRRPRQRWLLAWGTRESVGQALVHHGQPVLGSQLFALHPRQRGVVDRQHAELGIEHFLVQFLVVVVELPEFGVGLEQCFKFRLGLPFEHGDLLQPGPAHALRGHAKTPRALRHGAYRGEGTLGGFRSPLGSLRGAGGPRRHSRWSRSIPSRCRPFCWAVRPPGWNPPLGSTLLFCDRGSKGAPGNRQHAALERSRRAPDASGSPVCGPETAQRGSPPSRDFSSSASCRFSSASRSRAARRRAAWLLATSSSTPSARWRAPVSSSASSRRRSASSAWICAWMRRRSASARARAASWRLASTSSSLRSRSRRSISRLACSVAAVISAISTRHSASWRASALACAPRVATRASMAWRARRRS